jgi:DNA-binding HxlR family transcriptional regulator
MNDCTMTCEDVIVLHLYRNRSHLEDRRLPFAVCREGIRMAEGISIAHVSIGVRNLERSGFVFFEKRYVETKRGPCMAYSLTPLGVLRAKIIDASGQMSITSIKVKGDRSCNNAILRRRVKALETKVISRKKGLVPRIWIHPSGGYRYLSAAFVRKSGEIGRSLGPIVLRPHLGGPSHR